MHWEFFSLLLLGVFSIECPNCHEVGTKFCKKSGKCECKPGFTGIFCDSCDDFHFGENCHPIDECCAQEIKFLEKKSFGNRRLRRQADRPWMLDVNSPERQAAIELDKIK